MTRIIAIYSMKGGVGKTTLAVNLAWCSAMRSLWRTLLWDIDAQGAASFLLDQPDHPAKARRIFEREVKPGDAIEATRWPGLDLIAADISLRRIEAVLAQAGKPRRLRKLLQDVAGSYDRIVLDCPPGLGELTDQVLRAADLIVVPVVPNPLALRSFEQVRDHIARHHDRTVPLLPVFSMADRRKLLHRDSLAAHPNWPIILHASVIERMAIERAPVVSRGRRLPAVAAFADLWLEVDRRLAELDRPKGGRDDGGKPVRIPALRGGRKPRRD